MAKIIKQKKIAIDDSCESNLALVGFVPYNPGFVLKLNFDLVNNSKWYLSYLKAFLN